MVKKLQIEKPTRLDSKELVLPSKIKTNKRMSGHSGQDDFPLLQRKATQGKL